MTKLSLATLLLAVLALPLTAGERPKWLTDVSAVCKKSELCAVGMGESRILAQASATANIAKIFETKVDSTFNSTLSNDGETTDSSAYESITESTSMALEGVEHPLFYEDDQYYYALGKVKKMKMALGYKSSLDKIDGELKSLIKDSKTGAISKMDKLLKEREVLAARYRFLTGFQVAAPISYEAFLKRKREVTKGIIVHLFVDEPKPKKVQSFLGDKLTAAGYPITKGKLWKKESTHLLTGKLRTQKEFLSVEGFEKHRFTLTLDAQNRRRVKTGSMSIEAIETGRSFEQAYAKAIDKLRAGIEDQLFKISFEK